MINHFKGFTVLLVLTGLLSCNLSPGDPEFSGPSQHERLEELGIETDLGQRKDPNGNPLPENYNPLGAIRGTINEQSEIFLSGVGNGLTYYDGFNGDTDQLNGNNAVWLQNTKKLIGADVDGDGRQEMIAFIAYPSDNYIGVRVIDYLGYLSGVDTDAATINVDSLAGELTGEANTGSGNNWENAYARFDTARGDTDGDGRDELLLIVGLSVWVLDDASADFTILYHKTMEDLNSSSTSYVRGDMADFDLDGRSEIVLSNGEGNTSNIARFYIFDDILTDPELRTPLATGNLQAATNGYNVSAADVATGDFDGDGLPETAFSGRNGPGSGNNHVTVLLDTSMNINSQLVFTMAPSGYLDEYEGSDIMSAIMGVVTGDIDGNGLDEIISYNNIYVMSGGNLSQGGWGDDPLYYADSTYNQGNQPWVDLIACGDVTGDNKEDIVFLTWDEDELYIFYSPSANNINLHYYQGFTTGVYNNSMAVCLADVDGDSGVLKYTGHELQFTDPIVLSVLASPPYYSGVNDHMSGTTSLGAYTGSATQSGTGQGFSVGCTFGIAFDAPFGLAEAEAKTTIENSFNWGTSTTKEVIETWEHATSLGEDKVVFTSIPFDVYYYEVLCSPDSTEIGQTITINVPREPRKYHQEVNYFNSRSPGFQIDASILTHSVGEPDSYPGIQARNSIMGTDGSYGIFTDSTMQTGSSNGYSSLTLDSSTTKTSTFEYSLDITVEAEVQAGGFIAGGSAGYQYGFSYSNSVTSGTVLYGQVPDIPTTAEPGLGFNYGLMAYSQTVGDQQFTVLTYWVE